MSNLVSTCRRGELPHGQYGTSLEQPNLLLTDYTFICFHLVAAKTSSSEFINSFIHAHVHSSIHQTSIIGLLLSCTNDLSCTNNYGRCWLSLASTEAVSRDDLKAKKPQGMENMKFPSWHSFLGVTVTLNTCPRTPEA